MKVARNVIVPERGEDVAVYLKRLLVDAGRQGRVQALRKPSSNGIAVWQYRCILRMRLDGLQQAAKKGYVIGPFLGGDFPCAQGPFDVGAISLKTFVSLVQSCSKVNTITIHLRKTDAHTILDDSTRGAGNWRGTTR